jgi:hypothetical protein
MSWRPNRLGENFLKLPQHWLGWARVRDGDAAWMVSAAAALPKLS